MNAGLAWILVTAREFDWCIEQSHTAIDVDPTVTLSYVALGTAYEQKRMYAEAISSYEKGISIGGAVALSKAFLGTCMVRLETTIGHAKYWRNSK